MHPNFELDITKKEELKNKISLEIIKLHCQIYIECNDRWFYLNPDTIKDENEINVCNICSKNPENHEFSIYNGHDYGRLELLPELNHVSKQAISPIRIFRQNLNINARTCSGHAISFHSNGPSYITQHILPALENNLLPQVTFIGNKEKWFKTKQNYKNLYSVNKVDLFKWINVLSNINEYFREKNIKISNNEQNIKLITDQI